MRRWRARLRRIERALPKPQKRLQIVYVRRGEDPPPPPDEGVQLIVVEYTSEAQLAEFEAVAPYGCEPTPTQARDLLDIMDPDRFGPPPEHPISPSAVQSGRLPSHVESERERERPW